MDIFYLFYWCILIIKKIMNDLFNKYMFTVKPVSLENSYSLDHCSQPITLKRGSLVIGSMRTRSIAPGAAL